MTPIAYHSVPFDPIRHTSTDTVKRFACAIGCIIALGIVLGMTSSLIRGRIDPDHRNLREVNTSWYKCHLAYESFNKQSGGIYSHDVHIKTESTRFAETCYIRGVEDGFFENVDGKGSVICDASDSCFEIKPWVI